MFRRREKGPLLSKEASSSATHFFEPRTHTFLRRLRLAPRFFLITIVLFLAALATFRPHSSRQATIQRGVLLMDIATLMETKAAFREPFSQTAERPYGSKSNFEGNGASKRTPNYHIVFSTGCSKTQHWQSYVFFYQAMTVQQPGSITRIASGCSEQEEMSYRQIFQEQIAPMSRDRSFHVHFTPDYSLVSNKTPAFHYFNKPFGLRHWMMNQLAFPNETDEDDTIIVLMDPDQLILRPFRDNNFDNNHWVFLQKSQDNLSTVSWNTVGHGQPMGQRYGLGAYWRVYYNLTKIMPLESAERVKKMRDADFQRFVVGPPYIATARDMWETVTWWCKFVVPLHDQSSYFLGEMFAHSLAVAHLNLSHQIASTFMVSEVSAKEEEEGWDFLDQIEPGDDFCQEVMDIEKQPHVLHYCQRYGFGPYFFEKWQLPPEIFTSCQFPLLAEPSFNQDILSAYNGTTRFPDGAVKQYKPQQVLRSAFMLCRLISAINSAAIYFKQRNCFDGSANMSKVFMFLPKAKN